MPPGGAFQSLSVVPTLWHEALSDLPFSPSPACQLHPGHPRRHAALFSVPFHGWMAPQAFAFTSAWKCLLEFRLSSLLGRLSLTLQIDL